MSTPERLRDPAAVRAELERVGALAYAQARLEHIDAARIMRDVASQGRWVRVTRASEETQCHGCGWPAYVLDRYWLTDDVPYCSPCCAESGGDQ